MEKELMVVNAAGKVFWHGADAIDAEIEMDSAEDNFPGEGWSISEVGTVKLEIGQLRAWSCLTEEDREAYADRFYELWEDAGFGEPDYDSPNPWGCPWYWHHSKEVCSPEDLFAAYKDEIAEALEEEEKADAASEAFRAEIEKMYRN